MDGEQSPPRPTRKILLIAALIGVGAIGLWILLTRDPFPTRGSDRLNGAVAVKGWDAGALILADGRRQTLPGLKELPPATSVVLRLATRNGVEPQPDGRVIGLVPVYAKGGPDGWHPQFRVDLSRLLTYTGEGVVEKPLSDDARRCLAESPIVDDRGYEAQQFVVFQAWNDLIDQGRLKLQK